GGKIPFLPLVFAPSALHAEPFHFAMWSACGIPATSVPAVPNETFGPATATVRTQVVKAAPPGPVPRALHLPPRYSATKFTPGMSSRSPHPPPAKRVPRLSKARPNTELEV